MSDAIDSFSQGQRISLVFGAALTRFTSALNDLHELLKLAATADRTRKRPDDLRRLGDLLTSQQRKTGERAAEKAFATANEQLEKLNGGPPVESPAGKRHPIAPEQAVAILIILIGPDATGEVARTYLEECGEDPDIARYGLSYFQWTRAASLVERTALSVLPASLASLEELIGSVLRIWLTMHPDALNASNKSMTAGDASSYASGDDIKRWAIDEAVRGVIDGSASHWRDVILKNLKVDMRELVADWSAFLEAVARRHVIVHSGGRVDQRYLDDTGTYDHGHELGDTVVCDHAYISATLDTFHELGEALAIGLLAKLVPAGGEPAALAAPFVLGALERSNWRHALVLSQAVVTTERGSSVLDELRINWWMARRECGEPLEVITSEVDKWTPNEEDLPIRLGKAALLFDEEATHLILLEYKRGGGEIPKNWPLVVAMRQKFPSIQKMCSGAGQVSRSNRPKKRR